MPTYVFECESCEHQLEVEQSITKKVPNRRKCPSCHKLELKRLLFAPHIYNKPGDGEISVGHLAERNSKRFSQDFKNHLTKTSRNGPKKPKKEGKNFWETTPEKMKKIGTMTPKQQKKYVDTGET